MDIQVHHLTIISVKRGKWIPPIDEFSLIPIINMFEIVFTFKVSLLLVRRNLRVQSIDVTSSLVDTEIRRIKHSQAFFLFKILKIYTSIPQVKYTFIKIWPLHNICYLLSKKTLCCLYNFFVAISQPGCWMLFTDH